MNLLAQVKISVRSTKSYSNSLHKCLFYLIRKNYLKWNDVIVARSKNSILGHLENAMTDGHLGPWTALVSRITIFTIRLVDPALNNH